MRVFTVHRLFPFSHSLGSIPLTCVYLCNLAHINSILETNSNCMFSFSLLKASDSHKVLLCFFQGYQQVMRKSVTPHFQENAARSIGSVSCWHCQIDMYVGFVSVSWCPHSFSQGLFLTELPWQFFLRLCYLDEAADPNCYCG